LNISLKIIPILAGIIFLVFLIIPLIAILTSISFFEIIAKLQTKIVQDSLKLSLMTASISSTLVFLFATPLSFILARKDFRGKEIIDALIDVPLILPPAVAGLALLLTFAPNGLLGSFLLKVGLVLPGSIWAVILAQVFVASPFYFRSAKAAFESVDKRYEANARLLTKSETMIFIRIILPLSKIGLISGMIMCWARALGEFGATLMFAGNIPGVTQTMPVAIYMAMGTDIFASNVLSVILVIFSFLILIVFRYISRRWNNKL